MLHCQLGRTIACRSGEMEIFSLFCLEFIWSTSMTNDVQHFIHYDCGVHHMKVLSQTMTNDPPKRWALTPQKQLFLESHL